MQEEFELHPQGAVLICGYSNARNMPSSPPTTSKDVTLYPSHEPQLARRFAGLITAVGGTVAPSLHGSVDS
jgi:hypothetical protein